MSFAMLERTKGALFAAIVPDANWSLGRSEQSDEWSAARFVSKIRSLRFENTFNPYQDRCPVHDRADAPAKRSAALRAILEAASSRGIHSVWIGRDLGYRGGRR